MRPIMPIVIRFH